MSENINNKNSDEVSTLSKPSLLPVGELFLSAWRLYTRNFINFIEMYLRGLIGLWPLFAVAALAAIFLVWLRLYSWPFYIFLAVLALAALAWSIYYATRAKIGLILLLRDEGTGVKQNFQKSKQYFWPYIFTSFVMAIIIFLATCLFIVPGLILAVSWFFAGLLVILEDKKKVSEALSRSKELVKGYWWPVFGRFAVVLALAIFISLLFSWPMNYMDKDSQDNFSALLNIFWALISPLFLSYSFLLYRDLLAKKNLINK